ncbi:alpha/beta hydrolase family protein [Actinoplanes sp. NPDC049265]|uniref:alpha/beta hydrolase family protein n=1 Tax=Actinoplanes sp. NPDC049265 TaxID=3363902 RepID=UPI00371405A3
MTTALTRRHLLNAALAAGAAIPLGATWTPAAQAKSRLTLPRPTGPYPIGTVSLHLAGRDREVMASIWYPAGRDARRHPPAPWMDDAPLRELLVDNDLDPDAVTGPITAGHAGTPVLHALGRRPVVLYSHGSGGHRSEATTVVQELASHGYLVVTVDHGDSYTEFPGGRLRVPADHVLPWDHVHDIRFVLDRVEDIAAGRNPDAEGRKLPAGLGAALDLRRVGMFGWSKGGTATALTMNVDPRVRAGLSFDGPMESQPLVTDLSRPFMLMTAEYRRGTEPLDRFWSLLHGWRLNVQAEGAVHGSYVDNPWLLAQLGISEGELTPRQGVRIQQAYPLAFFDLHLRNRRQRLLEGPSPAFPKVDYLP